MKNLREILTNDIFSKIMKFLEVRFCTKTHQIITLEKHPKINNPIYKN